MSPSKHLTGPSPEISDTDALAQWTLFLNDYSRGRERPPPPPLRKSSHNAKSLPSFEVPLYPHGEISPEVARTIAEFYGQHGFLPPPRAEEESVRLHTIQEYNLFRSDQTENFHRCSSLVSAYFHIAPVCTISLFHNDVQVVVSKAGDFPVKLGEGLVTETSLCGHVVLKKNGEITELSETVDDWRFTGNPWCATGSVRGYVGVPIRLEVDPSNPRDLDQVTVGVIALMSNLPFPKLTGSQRKVLDDLSGMLSVQLRSTWEGWRRGKEARLRNGISVLLEKALVKPSQRVRMDTAAAMATPPVQGSESGRCTPKCAEPAMLCTSLFEFAAEQLRELLEADFAVIVDLTPFHATTSNGRRRRSHNWLNDDQESKTKRRAPTRVLASAGAAAYSECTQSFKSPEAMNAIANFLDMYSVTERSIFCGKPGTSGLEPLLQRPSTPTPSQGRSQPYDNTKTLPHLAIPFYSAMRPDVLLVVASGAPFFSFKQADVTFASNMGVVLVAHLVQSSIVESDAAKTAFVSQISHELRTPLHGLLGQLELLRDGFSSGDLSMVPNLLDSAEYCGVTLRDIVNDVLDFGKLAQLPPDGPDTAVRPQETALVDLVQITLETSRSCWLRRQQWRAISGDKTAERNRGGMSAPVELVVEYEDRSMLEKGWWVSLDVPGFRRILNNLMTNSLKYTAEGLITVSLVSQDGVDRNGQVCQQIALRVQDTGLGITPEFMDKLFEPFTQEDSFSPGAGLGLHITKSIVDRMHGDINAECRVGVGTTFTVILPVEDVEPRPPDKPTTMQQSIISQFARDAHGLSAPSPTFSDATLVASPSPPLPQLALQDRATPNGVSGSKLERDKEEEEEPEEPMKVLVVDDNAISRKILIAMLKRSNATAYQADDGLNALEVFREVHPHVVWTDVSMPRMDGVTAAKEMREIEHEKGWTPSHIVAITGLGMSDEYMRREALLGGAALDGWLIKGQTNLNSLRASLADVRQKLKSGPSSTRTESPGCSGP